MILTGFNILSPKAKSGGCAPRLRLTLLLAQKSKQKRAYAGHVWRVKAATSIQIILIDQKFRFPPQDPRLLRASPSVESCNGRHCFQAFA